MTTTSGLLLVDKPAGLTSHDVVTRLRAIFHERRIGHAGTLDPMATGLLVVAIGPSTRLLRFAQAQRKRYLGTVELGVATDSLDADGAVTMTLAVPMMSVAGVNEVARTMRGAQLQVPPMVSSLKVGGRRLHALAREGVHVERAPRDIVIDSFELFATADGHHWDFDVTCSVGTYVRVLLSDLAEKLGTVGHLSALRRVESGHHHVENAHTLDELAGLDDARSALLAPSHLVDALESTVLDGATIAKVRRGQRVALPAQFQGEEIAALDEAGDLVGVLGRRQDSWKPEIVMVGDTGAT